MADKDKENKDTENPSPDVSGNDGDVEEQPEKEELFYDGKEYLTKEEFFNPPEEEKLDNKPPGKKKRFFKIMIASLITMALLVNVFAVWPQLFNFPAVEFLSNASELSDNEKVEEYKESVVVVRTENSKGTGFVFGGGYIMTNEHVIRDGVEISVHFENGESYLTEEIEVNEELDIAVLKPMAEDFPHPSLEINSGWSPSEQIYVIGNPRFFNFIPNEGVLLQSTNVSSKNAEVIALEAPIYRGSSGSPVITEDGEVAGVVFATSRINVDGSRERVGLAIDMENIIDEMNLSP
ncbi:trypsin-like peptidase domain-containing protein [Alkalicoccus halolimnae]|uniref:Trypsin-like peptidase domain-containing protein n=1 Tax=Alkalicoccus halolimnae TaxID=1667239 RepID=A0A5C7F8Z1_9BACI|nr:trypsin-like peptidase domain-containing protein [Alkalicoccus halolimnae]TXF87181.1 serine protease [Alkalicoccus halolimnae]